MMVAKIDNALTKINEQRNYLRSNYLKENTNQHLTRKTKGHATTFLVVTDTPTQAATFQYWHTAICQQKPIIFLLARSFNIQGS